MAEFESYYVNDGPRREQVVQDMSAIIAMGLKRLGQDGNLPDLGEPARPLRPLNPSHLGDIALNEPDRLPERLAV